MTKIKRALLSVSDKSGIVDLARYLSKQGVEILSTGGTQRLLQKENISVRPVEDYTEFPEMMDGRVKTLHPKIHGGILNLRDNPQHQAAKKEHGIVDVDLVVVNLYPFEKTIQDPEVALKEAIENIDIGGPTMIRSAAKNWEYVAVVVDPNDYDKLKLELENSDLSLSRKYRFELMAKAFSHTAAYDGAISNYMTSLKSLEEKPERELFP
ncbi:MAG: bifunctional phosphoribosylaminoimidazolecarboxamide formyltransferase/IMP cyclohydrolase, partial [Deltaproteobacteria bacterium]|nr:bifunctional phosphoribosylaminoimidazolecarboxamide formyltransferase/IMP cyclohydrolase [Deltaproteobacteria bacterium]